MAKKDYTNWDKNDLIKAIGKLRKRKKYGLVWEDKPENVVAQCTTQLPVLEEVKSKEIITSPDKPVNLLIEGDNYHALSVLNYTHKGKIDVIYIDPPYNKGNKDFKYNDNYVDNEDAYRHSKWLSFIEKRLKLALNLLSTSNGVIFLSIDDNEQAPLRLLCDEIFGENNFLGTLTWVNKTKPVNSGKAKYKIQQNTEYVFVYSRKKKQDFKGFYLRQKGERKYPQSDKEGVYRLIDIEDSDLGRKKRDTMKFNILGVKPGVGKRWKIGEYEVRKLIQNNRIVNIEGKIIRKIYKHEESGFIENPFWSHLVDVATAEVGKKELSNIVGLDHSFDTVKPVSLIQDILSHFDKNISTLDFFAGSGTTGHAVLELNKADAGNRKFILCTNNENGIAEEVCYPRIEKVINGYKFTGQEKAIIFEQKLNKKVLADIDIVLNDLEDSKASNKQNYDKLEVKIEDNTLRLYGIKKSDGKKEGLGGNLKYFKTSFVPADPTDKNKIALTEKATVMLCIKEDTFEEVKSTRQYRIFRNKKRYTGIVFDHQAIDDFKKEMTKIDGKFSLYIFSLGDDTFDEGFEDLKKKVKLSPIPEAILKVYREIFKPNRK